MCLQTFTEKEIKLLNYKVRTSKFDIEEIEPFPLEETPHIFVQSYHNTNNFKTNTFIHLELETSKINYTNSHTSNHLSKNRYRNKIHLSRLHTLPFPVASLSKHEKNHHSLINNK